MLQIFFGNILIDDVRIYDRALSAAEVQALYNLGQAVSPLKPSVHLSRSNGYRELGMYGESINELESIEGDEKWGYPPF